MQIALSPPTSSTPDPRALRSRQDPADFRRYADRRDAAARDRLIRTHLPLATSIARRFDRGRVPFEDLKQVAAIGLVKAVDRFDPDNGAAFSSFAVPTIQGELRRYFRDFTWAVRPPRDLQERAVRIERERDGLTSELGRSPTAAELGERIGCTPEEVVEAAEATYARATKSFESVTAGTEEEGVTLGERIGVEDRGFAAAEASAMAERLLATLPERERLAVRLRFCEDMTQAEIGRRIGCSQMHVSRILRAALAQLGREAVADPHDATLPAQGPLVLN
jgi:RNA polymerase sigma-B factor